MGGNVIFPSNPVPADTFELDPLVGNSPPKPGTAPSVNLNPNDSSTFPNYGSNSTAESGSINPPTTSVSSATDNTTTTSGYDTLEPIPATSNSADNINSNYGVSTTSVHNASNGRPISSATNIDYLKPVGLSGESHLLLPTNDFHSSHGSVFGNHSAYGSHASKPKDHHAHPSWSTFHHDHDHTKVDRNIFKRNMSIAKGFMDIGLFSANCNQLRHLMNFGDSESASFYLIMTLLCFSIVSQVGF